MLPGISPQRLQARTLAGHLGGAKIPLSAFCADYLPTRWFRAISGQDLAD